MGQTIPMMDWMIPQPERYEVTDAAPGACIVMPSASKAAPMASAMSTTLGRSAWMHAVSISNSSVLPPIVVTTWEAARTAL